MKATNNMHRIVIIGGGAGGLELATWLGDTLGKQDKAAVTLIDRYVFMEAAVAQNSRGQREYSCASTRLSDAGPLAPFHLRAGRVAGAGSTGAHDQAANRATR